MNGLRVAGWLAVAGLTIVSVGSRWWSAPEASPFQLTADEQEQLAELPEPDRPAWLTRLQDRWSSPGTARQVLLIQAVPNEPPLVVAAVEESDGDEEPTHWRVPWPGVNESLASGLLVEPMIARSRLHGFDYIHHLVPLKDPHLVLLVNEIAPAPPWTGWRTLALILAALLAIGLLRMS